MTIDIKKSNNKKKTGTDSLPPQKTTRYQKNEWQHKH
jgi:hypothetical protein